MEPSAGQVTEGASGAHERYGHSSYLPSVLLRS